jgi:hypothetical protein
LGRARLTGGAHPKAAAAFQAGERASRLGRLGRHGPKARGGGSWATARPAHGGEKRRRGGREAGWAGLASWAGRERGGGGCALRGPRGGGRGWAAGRPAKGLRGGGFFYLFICFLSFFLKTCFSF